jgi:hypothetical protein
MPATTPASPQPPLHGDSYRIQRHPADGSPVIAFPSGNAGRGRRSPHRHRQPTP